MEKHREIDQAAREWFVLKLEEAEGQTLRGKVESTADSQRRSFDSGEELLAILRAIAGGKQEAISKRLAPPTVAPDGLDPAPAPGKEKDNALG